MSVEVMRSVIDAAEGRVPVDTLFTNAQIVDVYGQRVAPGSVAVKDGVIVGVLYDVATMLLAPTRQLRSSTARSLSRSRFY